MVCRNCNTPIAVGDKFCPKCGADIEGAANVYSAVKRLAIVAIFLFLIAIIGQVFLQFLLFSLNYNAKSITIANSSIGFLIPIAIIMSLAAQNKSKSKLALFAGILPCAMLIINFILSRLIPNSGSINLLTIISLVRNVGIIVVSSLLYKFRNKLYYLIGLGLCALLIILQIIDFVRVINFVYS